MNLVPICGILKVAKDSYWKNDVCLLQALESQNKYLMIDIHCGCSFNVFSCCCWNWNTTSVVSRLRAFLTSLRSCRKRSVIIQQHCTNIHHDRKYYPPCQDVRVLSLRRLQLPHITWSNNILKFICLFMSVDINQDFSAFMYRTLLFSVATYLFTLQV